MKKIVLVKIETRMIVMIKSIEVKEVIMCGLSKTSIHYNN